MEERDVQQTHRDEEDLGIEGGIDPERLRLCGEEHQAGRHLEGESARRHRDGDTTDLRRILEAACDERRIEHRDGADEESGAEHVKHVGERERIGGVAGEMAEARVLQGAQRLGIDVHHQRSSKVLPATEMRSARISRSTRVDG